MSEDKPRTDLDQRLENLSRDQVLRPAFFLLMFVNVANVLSHYQMEHLIDGHRVWFDCTAIGVFAVVVQRVLRYELRAVAFAVSTLLVVPTIALWYDSTGVKRPPNDQYTFLAILAGVAVTATTLLVMRVRNLRERERLRTLADSEKDRAIRATPLPSVENHGSGGSAVKNDAQLDQARN